MTGGWGVVFETLSLASATPVGLRLPLGCAGVHRPRKAPSVRSTVAWHRER